ncbi:MAG: hypothetical protein K2M81_05160, partial [Lachnospiraceae bacterium]|nr:hypothetical protein [Lachnospiraceae bacterium]
SLPRAVIETITDLCTAIRKAGYPLCKFFYENANGVFDHPWSNHTLIGRPVRLLLCVERDT